MMIAMISLAVGVAATWLVAWLYYDRTTKQVSTVHKKLSDDLYEMKLSLLQMHSVTHDYRRLIEETLSRLQSGSVTDTDDLSTQLAHTKRKEQEAINVAVSRSGLPSDVFVAYKPSDTMACPECGRASHIVGVYPAAPYANVGYRCPVHGTFMGGMVDGIDD